MNWGCALVPRKPAVPWAAPKEEWPAGQGNRFPGASHEKVHKDDQNTGTPLPRQKAGRAGAVQPGEDHFWGSPSNNLSLPKWGYKIDGGRIFLGEPAVTGHGVMASKQKRIDSD